MSTFWRTKPLKSRPLAEGEASNAGESENREEEEEEEEEEEDENAWQYCKACDKSFTTIQVRRRRNGWIARWVKSIA